ncbi:hypothetical protein COCVIDRAFT_42863 [Bipolaris victoriae FI3]|uniref:Transcription factor domain-containing protein n=1 Tax=Bipolaris victoriae (strain FI3) TaxID=930091 RepID=W7DSC8_BIPV3|nr:hypothetical protein COCVIDRAFT_42863 [Bipolaris victoriae FI3]
MLRKSVSREGNQPLDLTRLPTSKPIEGMFAKYLGIVSLLLASLSCEALLDLKAGSAVKVALLDAVAQILYLAEKPGSGDLPALIHGSVSTTASLGLHSESGIRSFGITNEQVIQVERAMWMLYYIDKSALQATGPPMDIRVRSQYSKICLNILELSGSAKDLTPQDLLDRIMALSTALEEWQKSDETSQMTLSLGREATKYVKFQPFKLLQRSIQEIITYSNTTSPTSLLQDWNHVYTDCLSLCSLSLDILSESDRGYENQNQALLNISSGFFARRSMTIPHGS